jgi:2,3-bisphosphoglycerate-independent phosphoglycerate mutase
MKYIVMIGDGMADWPIDSLGGLTPLQYAKTPNLDHLAEYGNLAQVKTVPQGMSPGSDVATLSIMSYNPEEFYTGRAPLEAASMGIKVSPSATIFRCNTVTVQDGKMVDYSAGHISTEESKELILTLRDKLLKEGIVFYPGVSYRHIAVLDGDFKNLKCLPPHDITDKSVAEYLPKGDHQDLIRSFMECSKEIFKNHPVNQKRIKENHLPATQVWLWGQGKPPTLPDFQSKHKIEGGTIISAVDLVKGIGKSAGFEVPDIPGATGYLDTNYAGKVEAAQKALMRDDFVLIHIEAPDECGHQGRPDLKVQAIEDFDKKVVGPMLTFAQMNQPCRVMVLPDHPTPCAHKTHVNEPVPVLLHQYPERGTPKFRGRAYSEANATQSQLVFDKGYTLMDYFLHGEWE